MTTTVNRSALLDALRALRPVAGTNPTLPVLANVALASDHDGSLTLTTTNMEVAGRRYINFSGDPLPATTVPVKTLGDFVGGFTGDDVKLDLDGNKLRLTCGRQKASLATIDAEDFPAFPSLDSAKAFTLGEDEWATVVRVAGFAAKDTTRPILTGVWVQGNGDRIRFAGADNYRVGVATVEHQATVDIVIPASSIALVTKVCGSGDVSIATDGRIAAISGDAGSLVTRLIEGQYPNIDGVLPSNQPVSLLVAHDEFAAAAKLALVASDIVTKFEVVDEGLRLYSSDFGKEFDTTLEATVGGSAEGPITFALKTSFVVDAAAVLGDATSVEFLWSQRLGPVELRDHDDPSFRAVIMPVRTAE